MAYISAERSQFAFAQLATEHGGQFEQFVNAFLITEIPALRPVAGLHDGARDAFIYSLDGAETVFLQSSVTATWPAKIRRTIATLEHNGNTVTELIYCTNRSICARRTA